MALEKIDTMALASLVECCYDLSMDGRLDHSQRHAALTLAKRLRGSLLPLVGPFRGRHAGLSDANGRLRAVTARLQAEEERLDQIAGDPAPTLPGSRGSLDRLLGGAAEFL